MSLKTRSCYCSRHRRLPLRAFYENLGFRVHVDSGGDGFRVAHLTPPGSAAAIIIGRGITEAAPGSPKNTLLAVEDFVTAREELVAMGNL